jgi:adenylate kinase family enzyme
MKNIIIVGASRSGKSTLAKKICKEFNYVYIPFDAIISTLENLYPETGLKHLDDNEEISPKFAKFIAEFTSHLDYEDINYVFDLYQLYPQDLLDNLDKSKFVILYLGYPNLSPEEKHDFVKKFAREKDWTRNTKDQEMLEILKLFIRENKKMYEECIKLDIPFFDTGSNFDLMLDNAYLYIKNQITNNNDEL